MSEHGAKGVRRLFAGKPDQEFSSLYTLDTVDQAGAQRLRDILNDLNAVEYARDRGSRSSSGKAAGPGVGCLAGPSSGSSAWQGSLPWASARLVIHIRYLYGSHR